MSAPRRNGEIVTRPGTNAAEVVLEIRGALDRSTAELAARVLRFVTTRQRRTARIDLGGVTTVDLDALDVLLHATDGSPPAILDDLAPALREARPSVTLP